MRSTTSIAALTAAALTLAACGGDEGATRATTGPTPAALTAPTPVESVTDSSHTAPPTTVPDLTAPPATVPASTAPPTSPDEMWREQVDAACAHWAPVVALPAPAADQASLEAYAQAHLEAWESAPDISAIELPPGPGRTPAHLAALMAGQKDAIDDAVAGAAAGDFAATLDATERLGPHLGAIASAFAAAGQTCGPADAEVAANVALNVSMLGPWQVETGYGSLWVSQNHIDTVARIDPDSGEVLATIAMPALPIRSQPADGRIFVRTEADYVVIDAATNTVVATLPTADIGPDAGSSWAVDGALWICDGERLHRYDPTTLQAVAVVELGIQCGQAYATPDVAIAKTYNPDEGESGTSRAVFVDPLTNTVISTVELAGDAASPVVLKDAVFFPPQLGTQATVVDRATWTVTATPNLGRFIDGGSQGAFDGTAIYVIADKPTGTIAVIDPTTFELTGEIRALATAPSLNSLDATPGVLWAVNNSGGVLQRFDTAG